MTTSTHAPMTLRGYVAAEFRAEMARQQLSARRVAVGLGTTHRWVNARLSGQVDFTADDIDRLAAFLDRPVQHFIGDYQRPAQLSAPLPARPETPGSDSDLDRVTTHDSACAPASVIPLRTLPDAA